MARPRGVEDEELAGRLAGVFASAGYEGASLQQLAEAARLGKASLYHRYPGGKVQMADEVMASVQTWIADNVVGPLKGQAPLRDRIDEVVKAFNALYQGGARACLLNMLSSFPGRAGPYEDRIKASFESMIDALAAVAQEAGATDPAKRARRAIILLQGSLVLSRGIGTPGPFRETLASFADELVG